MIKTRWALSLCMIVAGGFSLIVLEYKLTTLSLKVPSLEESYFSSRQHVEKLELDLRVIKNPRALIERKDLAVCSSLYFPKQDEVMALRTKSEIGHPKEDKDKSSGRSYHLPLAKVFP